MEFLNDDASLLKLPSLLAHLVMSFWCSCLASSVLILKYRILDVEKALWGKCSGRVETRNVDIRSGADLDRSIFKDSKLKIRAAYGELHTAYSS